MADCHELIGTSPNLAAVGRAVPVHLHSKVTEVGQLELWCYGKDGKQKWKLEFNVREGR